MPNFTPQTPHTESYELASHIIGAAFERAKKVEDENIRLGRPGVQGESRDYAERFERTFSGYCAEAAVALHLGLDPIRAGDHFQNKPDVGGYDVMATKRTNGSLIFTPKNKPESVKILVIDESPWFHLAGCYQCMDAKEHPEWWREPRPGGGAWFVPQSALKPIGKEGDVRPIGAVEIAAAERFARIWRDAAEQAKDLAIPYKRHPTAEQQAEANRKLAARVAIRRQLEREHVESYKAGSYPDGHYPVVGHNGLEVHAIASRGAQLDDGEYGSKNRTTYNPGGLVVRSDVPPHLQTYHRRGDE